MKTLHQKRKLVKSKRRFTLSSKKKDKKLLLKMAQIAKLSQLPSHLQKKYVKTIFGKEEFKISFYHNKGTEVVALLLDGVLYISFRGTEMDSTDIVPHAVRCSKDINIGKVHRGYYLKLMQVTSFIKDKVYNFNGDVVFVGHSLGGALAQLAYLWVKCDMPNLNTNCYTFGSCKPMREKPKKTNKEVHNYYLEKDYVGMFPFGYYTLTEPILINSNKKYRTDTFPFWNVVKALSSIFVTKRHGVDNYIKEIKGIK